MLIPGSTFRDIVDTEPFQNGNLLKMLLGATSDWFDDEMLENQDDGKYHRFLKYSIC